MLISAKAPLSEKYISFLYGHVIKSSSQGLVFFFCVHVFTICWAPAAGLLTEVALKRWRKCWFLIFLPSSHLPVKHCRPPNYLHVGWRSRGETILIKLSLKRTFWIVWCSVRVYYVSFPNMLVCNSEQQVNKALGLGLPFQPNQSLHADFAQQIWG